MTRKNLFVEWENENDDIIPENEITQSTTIRIYFLLIFIALCYFIIVFRLLSLINYDKEDESVTQNLSLKRGNIYDANGYLLATNLPTKSVYIKPDEIISDVESTIKPILNIINERNSEKISLEKIKFKIDSGKSFVWIKRHILPDQYVKIQALGIPSIYFVEDNKRFYPYENDFSHVIGFVDIDQNGISGIEKEFDELLTEGKDLHLSLNVRVQATVREKLQQSIINNDALGGMAVIMNANNGEIVSIVSLPDFNPNRLVADSESLFNRATLGVYEMGSTFKILTLAIGLDLGVVKFSDTFNVMNPLKLGRYTVNDYKFHKANLSLSEVLIFSSNRGIAQVGYKIGINNQQKYIGDIGMLSAVNIELQERGKPIHVSSKQWNEVYLATISYGHGIAVTPLHSVQSIAAVVNGGLLYTPTLLKLNNSVNGIRIFKESTSQAMRKVMRRIVEEGYAKKAEVSGYNIGGKTGTAEKVKNGRYMKKNCNLVSFCGAFPIDNPQYVIFVAVDEPKPNKLNSGFATGGQVAAPLAAEILKEVGFILLHDKS